MACKAGVRQAPRIRSGDPDSALVRAAQDGSPQAFGELVRRHRDRIYNLICGMVADPDDALNLAQETFIQADLALGRFGQRAGFSLWLYQIAVDRYLAYGREREQKREPVLLDQWRPPAPSPEAIHTSLACDPGQVTASVHFSAGIRAAVRKLPEPFRTAVLLRDIEGLSASEIARIMRCSRGAASLRIHRGRCMLRDALRPFVQEEGQAP